MIWIDTWSVGHTVSLYIIVVSVTLFLICMYCCFTHRHPQLEPGLLFRLDILERRLPVFVIKNYLVNEQFIGFLIVNKMSYL